MLHAAKFPYFPFFLASVWKPTKTQVEKRDFVDKVFFEKKHHWGDAVGECSLAFFAVDSLRETPLRIFASEFS